MYLVSHNFYKIFSEACEDTGFNVLRVISEPSAALLAYGGYMLLKILLLEKIIDLQ